MTDKKVYPVTASFEEFLTKQDVGLRNRKFEIAQIGDIFAEVLGEYEHGTAEPQDVFPSPEPIPRELALDYYKAVLEDVMLSFLNRGE